MAETAQLNWLHVSSLHLNPVRCTRKFLSILKKLITALNAFQEIQTLTMSN